MVNDKVAEATSSYYWGLDGTAFGEDMGILAAALETLEMEDTDDEGRNSHSIWNWKKALYYLGRNNMARLEAMPGIRSDPISKDDVKWERFGILLSGILSTP